MCDRLFASSWFDSKIIPFQGFQSFFYNRRYFLNFRWYLKKIGQGSGARLRGPVGPGQSPAGAKLPGSSWNLAFCGPKKVLQRLQIIKWFWKKNPINFLFRVQISPRSFVVFCFFLYIAKKNNVCFLFHTELHWWDISFRNGKICRTKIYCNFGTFIFFTTGSMPLSGGLLIPEGIH